jgi:succinate dehydrogenase flavin-adding protein (antitoxin of CptAB toxin-antitoxin module)
VSEKKQVPNNTRQVIDNVLLISQERADKLSVILDSHEYKASLHALEQHDPELVRLVQDADRCQLESLNRIVKHISSHSWLEN